MILYASLIQTIDHGLHVHLSLRLMFHSTANKFSACNGNRLVSHMLTLFLRSARGCNDKTTLFLRLAEDTLVHHDNTNI